MSITRSPSRIRKREVKVGEQQQDSGPGDMLKDIPERVFRALVDPMEIFDHQDQGSDLCALEHDSVQRLERPIFSGLGAHRDFVDPAAFDG